MRHLTPRLARALSLWLWPFALALWLTSCGGDDAAGVDGGATDDDGGSQVDGGVGGPDLSQGPPAPSGFALISDINLRGAAVRPSGFVTLGNLTLFITDDGVHGVRLFRTDGTAAGTQLVADLWPDADAARPAGTNLPDLAHGAILGGQLYFSSNDGTHGAELWRTDGTSAGTQLVVDLNPGDGHSAPAQLTVMGGNLYFFGLGEGAVRRLWKSDGTAAGTTALLDTYGFSLAALGDKILFTNPDPTYGVELWISDGTVAGTQLLKDIRPGSTGSQPYGFKTVGNQVYFWADDGVHGVEPWKSDGTAAGTVLVQDINPVGDSGSVSNFAFVDVGGQLYFSATDGGTGLELWKSDGTPTGTVLVKDINPGSGSANVYVGASLGGAIYFAASDGVAGSELWKTDGTPAGTVRVKDINPGMTSTAPGSMAVLGDALYFSADDGMAGRELWRSDGSEAGTQLVKDLWPGASAVVNALIANNGKLLFVASDATHETAPYVSDGSAAGTMLLADLNNGATNDSLAPLGPYPALRSAVSGGKLLFFADDGVVGAEPYVTDGTAAGTLRLADIDPGPGSGVTSPEGYVGPVSAGGLFFFPAHDPMHGTELWKSDGTPGGTQLVRDINPGPGGSLSDGALSTPLLPVGNLVYFVANDGMSGSELWSSDGTEAGTQRVVDLNPGAANGLVATGTTGAGTKAAPRLYPFAGGVVVAGKDANGSAVFLVAGGTVTQLSPSGFPMAEAAVVGTSLYFTRGTGGLWKSDGTMAGTQPLTFIGPDPIAQVHGLMAVGNQLAFIGNDGTHGHQLWVSDGTAAGTKQVKQIKPTGDALWSNTLNAPLGTVFHDKLYFVADDGVSGPELWVSDLTEAGTQLVADINPGPAPSGPSQLLVYRDQLYFVATDAAHGAELWRSDGTAAGTALVGDLNPGKLPSAAFPVGVLGNDLVLFGSDGFHGLEPWRYTAP